MMGTEVGASLIGIEEEIRRFWQWHGIAQTARALRPDTPQFVVLQQPLAAAGQSRADQIRLLATGDLLARYRRMQGDAVQLQTGWAGHGLAIENMVERELGPSLWTYDLARFNQACRTAALAGLQQSEELAGWLGVWLNPADTYLTLSPHVIEKVWAAVHRLWETDQLHYEQRVSPFCPRCATPLSIAEAGRRSVEVEAEAAWVYLPWIGEPGIYLLAWAPAAWMLAGMVAVAVHPDADYVLVEPTAEGVVSPMRLLVAEAALPRLGEGMARVARRVPGKALRGIRYRPLFTGAGVAESGGQVVLSNSVTLDRGSGLLAVAPEFDVLSLALAQAENLPIRTHVDDWGRLDDVLGAWRGRSPLEAEPFLVEDLQARELLFRREKQKRAQALCPYCETPLLPLAKRVWVVGSWIVSRDRAWGTPLPIWTCETCGHPACIAGLEDLASRTGVEAGKIDPHRPAVDRLAFLCERCGGIMRRVSPVLDANFEAAVLPGAFSLLPGPADAAVGLGDKELGWLGDLGEAAALLRDKLAWRRTVALPEGADGLDWEAGRIVPADATRWAAYTGMTPAEAEWRFLNRMWHLVPEVTASDDGQGPEIKCEPEEDALRDLLRAHLAQTNSRMAEALDAGNGPRAAAALALLVDDLEAWGITQRPRLAGEVLEPLARLAAPLVPHLAEAIYRRLRGDLEASVHQSCWPGQDGQAYGSPERIALVRRLARLARTVRERGGIRLDQRLWRAIIGFSPEQAAEVGWLAEVRAWLAGLLGVRRLELTPVPDLDFEWRLGLRPGSGAPEGAAAALRALEPDAAAGLATQIQEGRTVGILIEGEMVTLLPEQVLVLVESRSGWAAAEAGIVLVLE